MNRTTNSSAGLANIQSLPSVAFQPNLPKAMATVVQYPSMRITRYLKSLLNPHVTFVGSFSAQLDEANRV